MRPTWPIRRKLYVCLGLLTAIVGILALSSFYGLYAYRGLVKAISRRADELPLANVVSQRVSDLRLSFSQMRKLPPIEPAGEPASAEPLTPTEFQIRLQAVNDALRAYQDALDRNDWATRQLGDHHNEWQTAQKIERALDRIAQLSADGQWVFSTAQQSALESELEFLRQRAAELPSYLHENLQHFVDDVRLEYRALIILAWVATISGGAIFALSIRLFWDWIFRPLKVLVRGSRRVAAGQFDYRIALETNDEMAELAEALNDMTRRFQEIRDDLDRQVRQRTAQVVRSQQMASVGVLAAGVAHEINNPLASIALCAESLEGRMRESLAADHPQQEVIQKYLRMIQDEAFRCKEITEKLLDFSRAGGSTRQQADLRELTQRVVEMVAHLGRQQAKQIELLPGPPCPAAVNVQEFKQVMLNLLTNALESLAPGGRVVIELQPTRDHAEILVSDNGCGMTPDVLEHLFEPFFTQRPHGGGTGLGLSIVYRIVRDHGGEIHAHSDGPNRGSQFRVRLPLHGRDKESNHRQQAA